MFLKRITNLRGYLRILEKSAEGIPESMTMIQHIKTVLTFQLTEYSFFIVGDPRISNKVTPTIISVCENRIIPEYHILVQGEGTTMLQDVLVKMVDWKKSNIFYSLPVHQLPFLKNVASKHGAKICSDVRIDMFVLQNAEKLPQLIMKSGAAIQELISNDAQIINSHWKFKTEESEAIIRKTIKDGIGYGLHFNNQLVSWALLNRHGYMGFLFTLPEARRHDHASSIVNKLSHHLLTLGITPVGFVEPGNIAAAQILTGRLGFDKTLEVTDVTFCPA